MNMKRTFKALLLTVSFFFASALSVTGVQAQNNSNSGFEGTWILDSIQVKEIMPDGIRQKTVLHGDDNEFIINCMWQITMDGRGTLLYNEYGNPNVLDAPYVIEDRNGDTATLKINRMPNYKVLKIQLLSESSMLITHSFATMQDMDISCRMYYSKSKK